MEKEGKRRDYIKDWTNERKYVIIKKENDK
jgi:hypothetical protein